MGQFFYGHIAPVAVPVALIGVCVHRWSRPFNRVRPPDTAVPGTRRRSTRPCRRMAPTGVRACAADRGDIQVCEWSYLLEVCHSLLPNILVCKELNQAMIGMIASVLPRKPRAGDPG